MKDKTRKEKQEVTIDAVTEGTRWLPVKLSDEQMRDRVATLRERLKEQALKDEERSVVARRFAEELKGLAGEVGKLSKVISTGEEQQNVKCRERKNFKDRKFIVTRLDTGEVIESRDLYGHELQIEAPLAPSPIEIDDPRVTLGEVAKVTRMRPRHRKDIDGDDDFAEVPTLTEQQAGTLAEKIMAEAEKPIKRGRARKVPEPRVQSWGVPEGGETNDEE